MSDGRVPGLRLADDLCYIRLKSQLIARTGLTYYNNRDELLADTIGRRLATLGLNDWSSYTELLADETQGVAEMDTLTAELTVGETYFFRDRDQFDAILHIVLPDILARNRPYKALRIWSAGCANGAEPYSLAMLLERELADRIAGWEVTIFATDINRRSLEEAREGRFVDWAMRTTSDEIKRDCFSSEGGVWTIHPEYQRFIRFAHLNLVESKFPPFENHVAKFDLILCRNVMIYLGGVATRRLISQFHDSLAIGGWFLVGAAEHNQEHFSVFRTVQAPGATIYQKIAQKQDPFPVIARRTLAPARAIPRAAAVRFPEDIEGLRRLANQGEWASAVRRCHELLARDKLNPVIYFYHALVLEQMGIAAEAERSLRQAIYLDRNFVLAHFHLGVALKREKDPRRAVRSFANVVKLLSGMRDEQRVLDEAGVTVGGLKQLTTMHLESLRRA